jgi:hypothetical protein
LDFDIVSDFGFKILIRIWVLFLRKNPGPDLPCKDLIL